MTDLSRRTFLSAASWSLAWPLVSRFDVAWAAPQTPPPARPIVTFDEPGFPVLDAGPLRAVSGARTTASVVELDAALEPGALLVWRHGSTFPAEVWPAIARFLDAGGALLYVSGEPWTRPVTGVPGARRVEPRTVSYLQALRLNQSYRLDANGASVRRTGVAGGLGRALPGGTWIAALEPRFAETQDFPSESGSPGARDALLRPLAYAYRPSDDPRLPFAAVAYAVDRVRGPFAGGRWTFWLASSPPDEAEWRWLLEEAARPVVEFQVDPTFGCFHDGEQPSVVLRAHRPGAMDSVRVPCAVRVTGIGAATGPQSVLLEAGEHATLRVPLAGAFPPGLYRVEVDGGVLGRATTGFWIFDQALFASGDALTFDDYTLRRAGRPEPVVGTTTMSGTVHRNFLFEPNAAVWDDTFAELASLGINAVRTGLWSGWRKISLEANVVDESVLRALEAYYLTARAHGIPVIFTVFAFVPEEFGGADPYLDPRALEGQAALVSALARRMAPAREFIWDLINEPSFESPAHLWSLRPSGSAFERRAFLDWLAARYQPSDPGASPSAWQDVVRRRWRLRTDEGIGVPKNDDFSDVWVVGDLRPYRALDFALFAQDAFARVEPRMRAALGEGGSAGAVTVGQDEGGLGTSPSPLFHHASVDFTCMHTWWNNDALLWDGLLAKGRGTPLLIGETGIMQRDFLSGEAVRTPGSFADLLSRKVGYAFAAGAFGVVQWCYETQSVHGFRQRSGDWAQARRRQRQARAPRPRRCGGVRRAQQGDVRRLSRSGRRARGTDRRAAVPRSMAVPATRAAVRAFYENLGISVRAVADHAATRDLGQPRVIVLPACRSVSDAGWQAIVAAVEQGALLICSGWFETDDAGLPAERLGARRGPLGLSESMARSGPGGRRVSVWRNESGIVVCRRPAGAGQDDARQGGHRAPPAARRMGRARRRRSLGSIATRSRGQALHRSSSWTGGERRSAGGGRAVSRGVPAGRNQRIVAAASRLGGPAGEEGACYARRARRPGAHGARRPVGVADSRPARMTATARTPPGGFFPILGKSLPEGFLRV